MDALVYILVAIVCLAVGFAISRVLSKSSANGAAAQAQQTIDDANKAAETIRREAQVEAKDEALKIVQAAEDEHREKQAQAKEREDRVRKKEDACDKRASSLDERENQLSSQASRLNSRERDLDDKMAAIDEKLYAVAAMSREEAQDKVLAQVRDECAHEAAAIIRESEEKTKGEADRKSREILSVAIQRLAADYTAERTVTTVTIPSDDVKGRIIGREGRNIRAFEQITGVNIIIDDSPETVTLSAFDPVRREVGRITLENLIADGRIHPARIEEMFKKAERYIDQQVQEAGEAAAFETGIHDLAPELVRTLGRLKFRTSFGQNVLQHSLEVASIASSMSSELGLDPLQAKRAGLLHDIGKAIDHEVEGSHAVIGADLARRQGESAAVVHAIEAHHADVEPSTVLAVLVQAADAVSAARPGARRESYDGYIKRLERLEEIANKHDGVERTYAMQAGREIRVMVAPEVVDDAKSTVLAHDIAKEIEATMQYPGQIHVVVIRESRSEALAK